MNVDAVIETCLYVDDLGSAKSFYVDVLGLEPHGEVPGRHVFLRCGGGMFLLFDPEATRVPSGDVPAHGARGPGHVAFAVSRDQLRAWEERFEANGVEVESILDWPNGGRSIYVRDPAGNSVELTGPDTWALDDPNSHQRTAGNGDE